MKRLAVYLSILALLALTLAVPAPSEARARRARIKKDVTTAATVRFTTDTTIFTRRMAFQADGANASVVYIGDSTLDATSTATLEDTAFGTLSANMGWSPPLSEYSDSRGEQYRVSDWYAAGSTGDKVRVTYEVIAFP